MGNQKIKRLIKKIIITFLMLGITTMSYADNFQIKHIYAPIVRIFTPPMSTASFPIAISTDNDVITADINGKVSNDDFGVFKTPLSVEMKSKMIQINRLLRLPHIEKNLITNNPKGDFFYKLDVNHPEVTKQNLLKGFEIDDHVKTESPKNSQSLKEKNSQAISQYFFDLVNIGYSKEKVKFADFYGTTNIFPKSNGLEVILALKNIGPFDVTITNPKEWGEIPKVGEDVNTDHFWYEIIFGGLYKDISWTTRFGLENKYLIKDEFQSEKALQGYFVIKSNSVRVVRFLIPYQEIKFRSNTGEIDGNRTKEGYVLLDYQAGVLDSNWNMHVNFGGVFSKRTWKEEKTSLVKGWVNLE